MLPCYKIQANFENVEMLASTMGWRKQLEKEKGRRSKGVMEQPEVDQSQKPNYSAKKL